MNDGTGRRIVLPWGVSYTQTWECPGSHQVQLSRAEVSALLEMLLGEGVAAQASSARLWDQTPRIVVSKPTYAAGARTAAVPNDSAARIFVLPRGGMGAHTVGGNRDLDGHLWEIIWNPRFNSEAA